MRPLTYDFPDRMRGLSSGQRELKRLEQSMAVAYHRGDKFALDYLDRRHQRASQALAVLRARHKAEHPADPEGIAA